MKLVLLAVSYVIQSSDPENSGLLLSPKKLWQAKLLACKGHKISDTSQHLTRYSGLRRKKEIKKSKSKWKLVFKEDGRKSLVRKRDGKADRGGGVVPTEFSEQHLGL